MGLRNKRPRYLNYSVNKKGPKTNEKLKKAVKIYEKLVRRRKIEGETRWIKDAFHKIYDRLKKYGIYHIVVK